MNERLLQFIWQFQYFNKDALCTSEGEALYIDHPGHLQKGQGPDFSHARIRLASTIFIGDVEIHLKATDWYKHHHQSDPHYRKVILHVVLHDDLPTPIPSMPTLSLHDRIHHRMLEMYTRWMEQASPIPCGKQISTVNGIIASAWLDRLGMEKLECKAAALYDSRGKADGHWEEIAWQALARSFGGKANSHVLADMANRLPLRILYRHTHQIHQTEALLFGQSGLLKQPFQEKYPQMLVREYQMLQKRYGLCPSTIPVSYRPVRPENFPTVRLAQLAQLLHLRRSLGDMIRTTHTLASLRAYFDVTANDYWNDHYVFDQRAPVHPKKTGEAFIDTILINVVIPLLFAIGNEKNDYAVREKAMHWLCALPAEKNRIIQQYKQLGWAPASALQTQGLLQLHHEYCQMKKCLECSIGTVLLRK